MTNYSRLILRIGILLMLVAAVFMLLLTFGIIPIDFYAEGPLVILWTVQIPGIAGFCLLVVGAVLKGRKDAQC